MARPEDQSVINRSAGSPVRMIGVAVADVSDWNQPSPAGKWSRLFTELARRFDLIDVVTPQLQPFDEYVNYARWFYPEKGKWKTRAGFNRGIAKKRTASVARGLQQYEGGYELVMQLQTLCAPGFVRDVPYAIYTDNTMALTRRFYPQWAPLSARAASFWMTLERDICQSASALYTCSEFARSSIIEDYGCAEERVLAAGGGINQSVESIEQKRYETPRALFVGIDFERKGGSVLLEAWPTVRARLPEAELVIAGPAKLARQLPPGVQHVGRVDRAQLARLFESSALFVLPSLFEPWGFVFFEAMGSGLPCVGTSCCAMPEIIDDGVTGRLVERGDPESLAQALIQMLSDLDATAAMGRAAHAKVFHGNTWSDVAGRIAEHLKSVGLGGG